MSIFSSLSQLFRPSQPTKDVALVLSGGGARGFAHIGAIEELQSRGYFIHSVAGTSMGALVGGFLACDKLDVLKKKALSLTRKETMQLIDFSIGMNHVATGDRLEQLMEQLLGRKKIEDCDIDFCCCASDLTSGKERVFREGSVAHAIRASISIPLFFKPVKDGDERLVDGSVHNIFPLDRINREPDDILVGVNVSGPEEPQNTPVASDEDQSVGRFFNMVRGVLPDHRLPSSNYLNMALRVCCLTLQNATQNAIRLTPPDLLMQMPMNSFGLFEFEHAETIIERGRQLMSDALDKYEASQHRPRHPF